ncbi:MAG: zinc-binding dehydrogenase [Candidatus Omnitrophica bacterium]|nr:zinc-binding dehydrogenase [Candidatus Omnitrophota bacterium]MDE2223118.1 zinc-binding dehydrogenase [Candidatus Omnitrophota bacterium]
MFNYPLKFRAAVLEEVKKPYVIREIEFAGPLQIGQVAVKLFYSGICGKQIEEADGLLGSDPYLPHLTGHEGSGEVLAVGPGVTKVKPGDLVVLHWVKGGGINSATPLYNFQGKRINAGWVSTFNDHAVVSESRVTPLPAGSDPMVAALLGCMATTGIGAVLNDADIHPYDTVAVYGCGGIGLCALSASRLRYPRKLIAVDVNEQTLETAKGLGATDVINPVMTDPIKAVRELTGGKGASKVIITTGNPKAVEAAINSSSLPGDCLMVGVPPKGTLIPFDGASVVLRRTIRGTQGGSILPERDIPLYYDFHRQGILKLDGLVSAVFEFGKINEAMDKMRGGVTGRCVLKF